MHSHPYIFKPNVKTPLLFTGLCLIYIYVLQYPLTRLMGGKYIPVYGWYEWVIAVGFVIYSSIILVSFLYLGAAGPPVIIKTIHLSSYRRHKRVSLFLTIAIVAVFFLWSYVMQELKIGMTIYTDFDPLPYKLVGILFYGRLMLQPMALSFIAWSYASAGWRKWLIFVLFLALSFWAALTSGSRFAAIMFSFPMLLLFHDKWRLFAFFIASASGVLIATLSRGFYLPYIIGGDHIRIYANPLYQEAITEHIWWIPFSYAVSRVMGIGEVLLTLNFGEITDSFSSALMKSISYFLQLDLSVEAATVKNVYGLSEDTFGGFGLDLFSNYWVHFGGDAMTYTLGLALTGWLMGKTHRLFSIGFQNFGVSSLAMLFFIFLFMLLFEGRANLFPSLLVFGWIFSRQVSKFVHLLVRN